MDIREKIIHAVIELGAKQGIDNFTIKDIAKKSNNSSSLIYYYFKDKQDAILMALLYVTQQSAVITKKALSANATYENNYKSCMRAIAKYFNKHKSHASFFMKSSVSATELISKHLPLFKASSPLANFLESGINDGHIKDLDDILLFALYPLVTYIAFKYTNRQPVSEEMEEQYIDVMWNAISTGEMRKSMLNGAKRG